MDSADAIKDWIAQNPELKNFDVPMLSDKENDIAGQFGVMLKNETDLPGYCANSVFIIDKYDKVRYHEALDQRMLIDIKEIKRIVRAFQATDNGQTIAMPTWKSDTDNVPNSRSAIRKIYQNSYGSKKGQVSQTQDKSSEDVVTKECDANSSWSYSYGMLACEPN